jgi:predicted regulator of Ras-like GTPase activity (Roadblock/LC7/MglB family)
MSELDDALSRLKAHEGVQHLLLLGRDGLLVRHMGDGEPRLEAETVAAMVPGLAVACAGLGRAGSMGAMRTVVIEFDGGVAVALSLSSELLLVLLIQPGVGFAELLRDLRAERTELARLL